MGSKYENSKVVLGVAQVGEVIDWAGSNVAYGISHLEGGEETLEGLGVVADGVKNVGKKAAKIMLKEEDYERIAEFYNELPYGAQVVAETAALSALPPGMRLAKGAVTAKPIPHTFKTPIADVKPKYSTELSGTGAHALSCGEGTIPSKPPNIQPNISMKLDEFGVAEAGFSDKIAVELGNSASNLTTRLNIYRAII